MGRGQGEGDRGRRQEESEKIVERETSDWEEGGGEEGEMGYERRGKEVGGKGRGKGVGRKGRGEGKKEVE